MPPRRWREPLERSGFVVMMRPQAFVGAAVGQVIGARRVSGRSGGYYPVRVISHRQPSTQSDPRIGLTVAEGCYLLSLHIAEVELATQSVRTQRGGWALRPEIMS